MILKFPVILSQIGMMHVKAAQLAVNATKVADGGSNANVFFGWE